MKKYFYKFKNFSFVSKLYSRANIQNQKIFKFTTDPESKREIQNKEKIEKNLKLIKELNEKIKIEDMLTYTTESTEKSKMNIMMKRDSSQEESDRSAEKEQLKPVNMLHKNKKKELQERLKAIRADNEKIKEKFMYKITKESFENDVIRVSTIKDLFSHSYSFNNRFLNPMTFESVNKVEDERPFKIRQEEDEINLRQHNLEAEIGDVLNDMIDKEMANFDIASTPIPQKLAEKPIVRSIAADLNQPSLLLVESDLNLNYDIDLEYERLTRLNNLSDDFGKKIREDQEKDEEKEEKQEVEDSEFFNDGAQPKVFSADLSNIKI